MVAWMRIHETQAVGTQQPLVARGNRKIGLDRRDIERQGSRGLSQIQYQRSGDTAVRDKALAALARLDAGASR